ncbi:hypothetical protein H7S74_16880 [Priestia aryabhattai]|uniref:hypothetical protein n=1 Tax=Priestia TaxID=2800373 RepID=UPI001ECB9183|nr:MULTISPECIES: hypothetical protein [Priestia]MBY0092596.1 hypothetical protein [Priestia aryabhattai]MBY0103039.1 hypothetical protein [Priestia aryabhattai]MCY9023616.1 hypothetical protein [Priestia megaterium]
MEKYHKALKQGQTVRKLQDESLALFVKHIQKIDDIKALKNIKKALSKGEIQ